MKTRTKRIIIGIFTIILIISMLIFVDINRILENLTKVSFFGIFLFSIIYTIPFLIRTYRMRLILENLDLKSSFFTLLSSYGIGWGINELTPGKVGDLVRMELIHEKDANIDLAYSFSAVLFERIIDMLILFAITAVTLLIMYLTGFEGTNQLNLSLYIIIFAFLIIAGIIFVLILFYKQEAFLNIVGKISDKLEQFLRNFLTKFFNALNLFLKKKWNLVSISFTSIVIWLIESSTLILFMGLTGFEFNILIIMLAQILIFFSKVLPITPGGWIISEGIGALFIYLWYPSVEFNAILSVIILDHFIRVAYIIVFCLLSALHINVSLRKIDLSEVEKLEEPTELE